MHRASISGVPGHVGKQAQAWLGQQDARLAWGGGDPSKSKSSCSGISAAMECVWLQENAPGCGVHVKGINRMFAWLVWPVATNMGVGEPTAQFRIWFRPGLS